MQSPLPYEDFIGGKDRNLPKSSTQTNMVEREVC